MKTLPLGFFMLLIVSATAAAPDLKPTPALCKADLKACSMQKTEMLTIPQIEDRMNEMYSCAEQSKKNEKKMRAYLDEFYRTHLELAGRSFDFITRHDLQKWFGEEENGSVAEAALKS